MFFQKTDQHITVSTLNMVKFDVAANDKKAKRCTVRGTVKMFHTQIETFSKSENTRTRYKSALGALCRYILDLKERSAIAIHHSDDEAVEDEEDSETYDPIMSVDIYIYIYILYTIYHIYLLY